MQLFNSSGSACRNHNCPLLPLCEAGMPFLLVDQLDVQVPQTTSLSDVATGRVRVILGVSGQWQAGSRGPRQLTTSAHQAYLNTPLPA
ncbi:MULTISPECIES: GspMb/PilO family protein [unclassified Bradyrhizobium]|uniref:GspMb/PilO family protein n=1 Tax=unclassified Bradyrhizobium TaxID=2631580 RepID=UPI0033909892